MDGLRSMWQKEGWWEKSENLGTSIVFDVANTKEHRDFFCKCALEFLHQLGHLSSNVRTVEYVVPGTDAG